MLLTPAYPDQLDPPVHFDFEEYLKQELSLDGDRKPPSNVCKFYLRGSCPKGRGCPLKHGRPGERRMQVVCKHWLKALCKKGDQCEFLHEYNLKRMPECWFYSKYGECSNGDQCAYLHVDPEARLVECPWYNRGFCKHGPGCPNGQYSLLCFINPGFSPKYELPDMDKMDLPAPRPHNDRPPGYLGSAAAAANAASGGHHGGRSGGGGGSFMGGGSMGTVGGMERGGGKSTGEYRPLSEVVCFKCGQKGHYANRCPN